MLINVLEYLEATGARVPFRTAVKDGESSLTFSELICKARSLAGRIRSYIGSCGGPVAVFLPRSKESVLAFTAILYNGNCYAPLDINSPMSRLAKVIEKLQPALIMSDRRHAPLLRNVGFADRILSLDTEWDAPGGMTVDGIPVTIDTDPVYIIHTSGSTGIPKGVVISHRSIIDYIDWARGCYNITEEETIGNQAPFHFDNSTLDIYLCLSTGATLVIIPDECFLSPIRLIDYIRKEAVTFIFWVPSALAMIANLDILSKTPPPPLRKILFAGEVMHNGYLNYWRRKFPSALFSNLYGPTEITVDCTYYIVDREFADEDPLPIGFPCRNSDVFILNEHDRPAGVGERGELCVRGSSLAHGYWNDPERTAAAFKQNPLNPHYPERIYRTGDSVYRAESGEIYFVGRSDDQIKHLGYRIELGEIETAALEIEGVLSACVVYDTARARLGMFYEGTTELESGFLRKALLSRLPKYMVPLRYFYVGRLPLNSSGKIDRKLLTARMSAGQ